MTRKTRFILLLFLTILFFLIAPSVIFYSQGYRFDFNPPDGGIKISQTGAFYFKVLPKGVQIYLQDEFKKKTDFFFGTVLLENLLPRKYKIEIKKGGYLPWKKTLEIKEKEVTEAKNIILFPENPRFNLLDKNVEDFFFSPEGKKIIFKTKELSDEKESWALKIFDLEKNLKSHLIEEKDILTKKKVKSSQEIEILDLKLSPDLKIVSLTVKLNEKVNYFTLEIDKTPPLLKEVEELPLFVEKDLKISPDLKKTLEFSDYEIWVLFLEDDLSTFHHKGDKIFLLRFSEKIGDIFWLTSHYLIFNVGDKIKIAEIDERDQINIIDLAEFKDSKIFFNQNNKKLYILSDKNLYSSEGLIP